MTCIHHHSIIQISLTTLNTLCSPSTHSFSPPIPGNHWFFFSFRNGKGDRKRSMWERNIGQLLLIHFSTRDQTCNPGMCPDWEWTSNISLCGTMPNQLSHTGQGNHWSFYCLCSVAFSRMTLSWNHTECSLFRLASLLAICALVSSSGLFTAW